MSRIEKIKDGIGVSIVTDSKRLIKVGSVDNICKAFGIKRPLFDSSIPLLIESKINSGGSKCEVSLINIRDISKRVNDSNCDILII